MTRTSLLALALVVVLVSSCGDDDSDVAAGDDTTTTTPSAASLPADDGDDTETRPADGEDAYAIADLTVEVTHPDEDTITYRLSCLGDTATIDDPSVDVSAEAACRQLTDPEAVTLLVDGPDPARVCAQVFGGPDEAELTGSIDGDEVDTVLGRTDGCAIDDWDRVLSDVLPPPATDR